jgi:hypothetical protein
MNKLLNALLVTALVAPLLMLTGCNCGSKDSCSYDKMGTNYTPQDGAAK